MSAAGGARRAGRAVHSLLAEVKRRLPGQGIARAVAGRGHARHALLMYSVAAFRAGRADRHQNIGQQREIAGALGEMGFEVDAVDYAERRTSLLRHAYDVVIDLHPTARPLYRDHLAPQAVRIAYITGSNPAFSNAAELTRLDALERRRGIRLAARRQVAEFPAPVLESYDAVFLIGNAVTLATYAGFRLPPVHLLPNSGYHDIVPTEPGLRRATRFAFLGSAGQVHKGLDLVLELFAAEPGLELVVCSTYAKEPDFVRSYRRELSRTPNIHAAGFVDVRSPAFRTLQSQCGAMLLPSCSEGQSGTATIALSYGLPCILSRECGLDDPEITLLPDCSLDTLQRTVRAWAAQTPEELQARARGARQLLERRYTAAHFAAAIRAGLRAVVAERRT
jgi:glycosyltransferase involved in cell wall biosynthesis